MVEVVGVLIAAGDRQHARAQDVRHAVGYQERVARIGDQRRESPRNPEPALGRGQQQNAAVGRHASAIKGGGDFLAANRWEIERKQGIFGHGGCGSRDCWNGVVSTPNP